MTWNSQIASEDSAPATATSVGRLPQSLPDALGEVWKGEYQAKNAQCNFVMLQKYYHGGHRCNMHQFSSIFFFL